MDTSTFLDDGGLSAEEFELLAYLLEDEGVALHDQQTIFPREQRDNLPLSFAQARLWFLDQLDPGNPAYNLSFAIRVGGRLDAVALQRSLNAIIARHEALRTTFTAIDGQPIQVIARAQPLDLPLLDLRGLPADDRAPALLRIAARAAGRSFDLARGPLIVAGLARLAEDQHILLLIVHHIIFDGWSTGVFLNEVIAHYDAFSRGLPDPLPALSIQYADFAIWQRQWLQGELLEEQLAYWRRQLRGSDGRVGPPALDLPLDRPRPPRQTYRGARSARTIPLALAESLAALGQRESATLFMALLAAFSVLLHRYTGQEDMIVGSPIANRDFVELERLVGFFVNTLLLRADLSGGPSASELLARVREMTFGAYAHQNIPFEQVVNELQPERDLGRNPLFQVMFALQNTPQGYERPDLSIGFLPIESATTMFDLLLSVGETPDGLNVAFTYSVDLFDAATIERMLDHFLMLVEGIVADPDLPIAQLPLLSAAERRQILIDWNATDADYPLDRCIHDLVAAQAARTPDAVAVVGRTKGEGSDSSLVTHLTYAELNRRANQLARHLRRLGAGPERLVGIRLARSPDLIVALLGALKAGSAYLPLDPAYPDERIRFMLEDSQARILVTRLGGVLGEGCALPQALSSTVDLSADWPAIARERGENLPGGATPDNLAYLIYTSGSTGQPKGALISHRALVNHTVSAGERFALGSGDRVLQFASISFDTAAEEIYPCLARGAALVLRDDAALGSAASFLATCDQLAITAIDLPTAYWHQLTAEIAAQDLGLPAALRLAIIGGEAALPDRVALWIARAGARARLANTYGPTEATIAATQWDPRAGDEIARRASTPIGRPIGNVQMYVLDARLGPTPVGVPGELYIGGSGLARGYHGRPDATAAAFVPNPFTPVGSSQDAVGSMSARADCRLPTADCRLYKTGDRARYRPDGSLEFLGRADSQIKIRGFRVEPSEVAAALQQHPAVRACAIVAGEAAPGDLRLVAYIVLSVEDSRLKIEDNNADATAALSSVLYPLSSELRGYLAERLPEYMIPSAFVPMDALPLTPSGKIDRQALPSPDWSRRDHDERYIAPRTPIEAAVAGLAAQVLGIERVGVRDNFFDLGGHSLLVVRLLSRIQQQFGQSLPLATLFQGPTVEHLAYTLRQRASALPPTPLVGIQPGGAKPPFFCVHPGAGGVLCYLDLAHHLGSAQPFYGLQAAGLEDDQPPRAQIEDLAAAYVAALRAVQPEGPYLLGGWSFGGVAAFEMARQLSAQGQRVALLALLDSWTPGAQPRGPGAEIDLLAGFAHDLGRTHGYAPPVGIDELRRVAPDRRLRFVLDQAIAAGLLPPDIDERQVRRGLDVFAANWEAMQHYQPHGYAGRVALLRAVEQPPSAPADQTLGWGALCESGLELHAVPGDHYTMIRPPHVRALAAQLSACIDAALAADQAGWSNQRPYAIMEQG